MSSVGTDKDWTQTICKFHKLGICRFGGQCRYSHILDDEEMAQSTLTEQGTNRRSWADAPIFVPRTNYNELYEEFVGSTDGIPFVAFEFMASDMKLVESISLPDFCPYDSPCPYGIYCLYPLHAEMCDLCNEYCLHPHDEAQRKEHYVECMESHEKAMELSFAVARSKDKTCGICMDIIMEKSGREKRFAILPNCNHSFCLECLRKWRQGRELFDPEVVRGCPICRTSSDFVCPSQFWVETKEQKDKLLDDYRTALGAKDCKYFKNGKGKCPFGNKCFYKHALPNGELVDVGLPKKKSLRDRDDLLFIYLTDISETEESEDSE